MTFLNLGNALKERLESVAKDYKLFDVNGEPRTPQVIFGYLPNKQTTEFDDYPCIIVRIFDGEDAFDGPQPVKGTVRVIICIFTYQESARDDRDPDTGPVEKTKGWDAVLEMIQRIRDNLLKNRLLANKFNLKPPLQWELPPEQAEPQWGGYITATYDIDVPRNEDYQEVLNGFNVRKTNVGEICGELEIVRTSDEASYAKQFLGS